VYNNIFIYTYVFFEKSSLADLYGFMYMDHIMYAYFTQRIKHVKVKSVYIYMTVLDTHHTLFLLI